MFTLEQLEMSFGGDKFVKRRIYDVLNVFQGIGIVIRVEKGVFRYLYASKSIFVRFGGPNIIPSS